jgi:hypothetical protein
MTDQRLKRKRALQRAYQQRSFEIEHYWKRAGYFWGFQLAIFAAFGLIWREVGGPQQWGPLALAPSSLGILTALANRLSAGGSKFWQENWEKHIDMLENEFEGRLYKTVWLSDGTRQYSVSKVNLSLSSYFVVFWIIVFGYVACRLLDLHLSTFLPSLVTPQTIVLRTFSWAFTPRIYLAFRPNHEIGWNNSNGWRRRKTGRAAVLARQMVQNHARAASYAAPYTARKMV